MNACSPKVPGGHKASPIPVTVTCITKSLGLIMKMRQRAHLSAENQETRSHKLCSFLHVTTTFSLSKAWFLWSTLNLTAQVCFLVVLSHWNIHDSLRKICHHRTQKTSPLTPPAAPYWGNNLPEEVINIPSVKMHLIFYLAIVYNICISQTI